MQEMLGEGKEAGLGTKEIGCGADSEKASAKPVRKLRVWDGSSEFSTVEMRDPELYILL